MPSSILPGLVTLGSTFLWAKLMTFSIETMALANKVPFGRTTMGATPKKILMYSLGKYRVRNSTNGQFYWILQSANGETLIKSETYTSKENCMNGVKASKSCLADSNFERKYSINRQYFFNQIANNYQVLGTSETYTTVLAREGGISAVKRIAPTAEVVDETNVFKRSSY